MRTTKFKDVLWAVARKAGFSPESGNFLSNQAIPIGEYISQWVDRIYPQKDWPEWKKILQVAPSASHVVPYRVFPTGPGGDDSPYRFGRILNVYLRDPSVTNAPISIDFTLLEEGVHVGFTHGTHVWIKYLEPPPEFSAERWRPDFTYFRDDLVYVSSTGECYRSRLNGNRNHSPIISGSPIPLTTELISDVVPDNLGTPERDGISQVSLSDLLIPPGPGPTPVVPDPPLNGDIFRVILHDVDGNVITDQNHVADGVETLGDVTSLLAVQLAGVLGGTWGVTPDVVDDTITIQHASDFSIFYASYTTTVPLVTETRLVTVQLQTFVPLIPTVLGSPQIIRFSLPESQIAAGGTYKVTFNAVDGEQRTVEYTATSTDSAIQVLTGIINQIADLTLGDIFFHQISYSLNATALYIDFRTLTRIGIDANLEFGISPWWDIVLFPQELFNSVVRGASADFLAEWGQTDKSAAEEGKVPSEVEGSAGDFEPTSVGNLSTQQKPGKPGPTSRYNY